jgi:replicative DNA helicase
MGKRPNISDLRESGAIEQDADVIAFLYRDSYYKSETEEERENESEIIEVIVAKNRHGATQTVKMGWIDKYTLFRSIDNGYE